MRKKRKRSSIPEGKVHLLEKRFRLQPFLTDLQKDSLAAEFGLSKEEIDEWYKDQAMKLKRFGYE